MDNPWGLGGKNPWKKDKKEPTLNKDEKNPWGLVGKKPWGKEETDRERIARLEKEVDDLKNNNKQEQDDDQTGNDDITPKGKKKFSLFGLFVIFLIVGGLWGIISPDDDKKSSNTNSKTYKLKKVNFQN